MKEHVEAPNKNKLLAQIQNSKLYKYFLEKAEDPVRKSVVELDAKTGKYKQLYVVSFSDGSADWWAHDLRLKYPGRLFSAWPMHHVPLEDRIFYFAKRTSRCGDCRTIEEVYQTLAKTITSNG